MTADGTGTRDGDCDRPLRTVPEQGLHVPLSHRRQGVPAGSYRVTITAQTLDGTAVTYGGNIEVGTPLPTAPPAASMSAAASAQKLFDSLGAAPQIAAAP